MTETSIECDYRHLRFAPAALEEAYEVITRLGGSAADIARIQRIAAGEERLPDLRVRQMPEVER